MKGLSLLVLLPLVFGGPAFAADSEGRTASFVFRKKPYRKLTVYYPDDWKVTDRRPALVIFRCRIPFQREYFRKLGMVVIKPSTAPGQLRQSAQAQP